MIKYLKYKDLKNRKFFFKTEHQKFIFSFFLKRKKMEKNQQFKFMLKNQLLFHNYFKNKLVNRCIISYKVRSVNRLTSLTKNNFKNYFDYGNLMGFKKSS